MALGSSNTDYLRFSAYSIKDLITRKLAEDTKFTDQVYEGSNLAVMIDIISYMYQCLAYQLNTAASESMFADTQWYENIVRLVKFLGYNPKGCTASLMKAYITSATDNSLRSYWIPAYSRVDTGLTDATGRRIYFSTARDGSLNDQNVLQLKENKVKPITLYNGEWKLHSTIFTASGIANETFVLEGVKSKADESKFVAHDFIDVYVQHFNGESYEFDDSWTMDKNGIFTGYATTDGSAMKLFNNETAFKSLYPGTYAVYTAYLNEEKTYELKFGNGVVGKKLSPGDRVFVFYLDTNGLDGEIDTLSIDPSGLKFEHSAQMLGISQDVYNNIFKISDETNNYDFAKNLALESNKDLYELTFNMPTSTTPLVEESVDDIKKNAPLWATTGNRLVTAFDYEYYIKNARNSSSMLNCNVVDAKCMNNWEYTATYYKWLYDLGVNGKLVQNFGSLREDQKQKVGAASPTRYLNKSTFTRHEYFFADSSDANNLYIWIKSTQDFEPDVVTQSLNSVLKPIKMMTAELVGCKAIDVDFDICAAPVDYALRTYFNESFNDSSAFDENCESYIEITLDDNALYVANSLQKEICNIILDAFSVNNCTLGQTVRYDDILNKIYAINGIEKVRTVFVPGGDQLKSRIYDGLSFASWSNAAEIIQAGDDLNVSNTVRQLEKFQFPVFRGSSRLMERIKIIKKSLSTVNTIKF